MKIKPHIILLIVGVVLVGFSLATRTSVAWYVLVGGFVLLLGGTVAMAVNSKPQLAYSVSLIVAMIMFGLYFFFPLAPHIAPVVEVLMWLALLGVLTSGVWWYRSRQPH